MRIKVSGNRRDLAAAVGDVIRIFYPEADFTSDESEIVIMLTGEIKDTTIDVCSIAPGGIKESIKEELHGDEEPEHQLRRLARLAVYKSLIRFSEKAGSPWGILTGIRPTKIVHRWLDQQLDQNEIISRLLQRFLLSEDKARLLSEVVRVQRPYIANPDPRKISIYLGIPFCPSRCVYCSFPGVKLASNIKLVQPYLAALSREIRLLGDAVTNLGFIIQAVYLGGGTPTSLNNEEFATLLSDISKYLPMDEVKEYTVEAGRPDTVNDFKLERMKERGVTRVSINPQSMHQETLDRVGRKHTVGEIIEKAHLTQDKGFDLNMDLILGLPGEDAGHVARTLEAVSRLKPDNLSVHTLAVKKKSAIFQNEENYHLALADEAERMLNLSREWTSRMQMIPYYLYRQKNMLGNLENIAYALPGKESIYNINIMEERQTIIGLGVGAGSKFVDQSSLTLTSFYNPKDILLYNQRVEEAAQKKIDKLYAIG